MVQNSAVRYVSIVSIVVLVVATILSYYPPTFFHVILEDIIAGGSFASLLQYGCGVIAFIILVVTAQCAGLDPDVTLCFAGSVLGGYILVRIVLYILRDCYK